MEWKAHWRTRMVQCMPSIRIKNSSLTKWKLSFWSINEQMRGQIWVLHQSNNPALYKWEKIEHLQPNDFAGNEEGGEDSFELRILKRKLKFNYSNTNKVCSWVSLLGVSGVASLLLLLLNFLDLLLIIWVKPSHFLSR